MIFALELIVLYQNHSIYERSIQLSFIRYFTINSSNIQCNLRSLFFSSAECTEMYHGVVRVCGKIPWFLAQEDMAEERTP